MEKPTGVTILAVLAAIGGFVGIGAGISLIGSSVTGTGFLVGDLAIILALVTLIISGISLVFAYGAWYLMPWAWLLGVIVEGLAILVMFIGWLGAQGNFFAIISIVITGAILYYLFTPAVRQAFDRVRR